MDIERVVSEAQAAVSQVQDEVALDEVRVRYLGKKGELTALLKSLGSLDAEERPVQHVEDKQIEGGCGQPECGALDPMIHVAAYRRR